MSNKKRSNEKIYWCQCYDVNQRIAGKVKGKIDIKDTGKVCSRCGYKIIETIKIDKKMG